MVSELRGVVLDLDDTLVLERDYVRSGFRAVGRRFAATGTASGDAAFALLWGDFEAGVRGDAFDRLLAAFPGSGLTVDDLIRSYREHSPELDLIDGWPRLLDELSERGLRLGVISDGPLASQAAKRDALRLDRWCDPIVLTDAWGRECWKPSPFAFETIERRWGLCGARLAYVGDNPGKDFVAPNTLGWRTVRLVLPGQVRGELPDGDAPAQTRVGSIDELRSVLLG